MLGRCGIGVRRTGFDDEELVLFYETSTFSDVIPAFSFVTIDQNVLFTAFFPLPIMVLRMGIVADIGRIEQAGHGILLHLEENLLRNHNGLFIGKSVFLLSIRMSVLSDNVSILSGFCFAFDVVFQKQVFTVEYSVREVVDPVAQNDDTR